MRPRHSLRSRLFLAVLPLLSLLMIAQLQDQWRLQNAAIRQAGQRQATALAVIVSLENIDIVKEIPQIIWADKLDDRGRIASSTDKARLSGHSELTLETRSQQAGLARVGSGVVCLSMSEQRRSMQHALAKLAGLDLGFLALTVLALWRISDIFTRPILRLASKARLFAQAEDSTTLPPRSRDSGEFAVVEQALYDMLAQVLENTATERERRLLLQTRLETLVEATDSVSAGRLKTRLACPTQDDIGRLETGFNLMVESLWLARRSELQAELDREWARISVEEANRRLQEFDRRKTDFLNTASHELRTPLTSISAFAEIIEDNLQQPQSASEFRQTNSEFLEIINQEADRLSRLIVNLLDLSVIESGAQEWEFENLELGTLIDQCRRAFQSLLLEKQLQLRIEQDTPIYVRAAPDPLHQVFTNLISNAIKFTPAQGHIDIRLSRAGESAVVEIQDSGIGIAGPDQARLFQDFQQAEKVVDNDAPKGSGLGLAICRDIIERHRGTILLRSEIGKGSCFTIRLPSQISAP